MSKPYSKEHARDMFLKHIRHIMVYWLNEQRTPDTAGKMDGLVFSILTMIDGSSAALPSFDIVTRPCDEDEAFCKSEGEDYWEDGMVINDDCMLHELWSVKS
jgi:hypothetical protein